jgi:hypothetical protein
LLVLIHEESSYLEQVYRYTPAVLQVIPCNATQDFWWCGGERARREKEVVASRNNHLIRQLHNHCMSCWCHATHNIPNLHAQIKGFYYSTKRLIRQLIVEILCWVDPILCVTAWTTYQTTPMYLPIVPSERKTTNLKQ